MADPVADNADFAVDELKRKARRRLVGAIVIALAAATILPLLLEQEQKPLGDDVSVQIPPVDSGKFVSRLTPEPDKGPAPEARSDAGAIKSAAEGSAPAAPDAKPVAPDTKPIAADAKSEPKGAAKAATPAPPAAPAASPPATPAAAAASESPAAAAPPADAPAAEVSRTEGYVVQLGAFTDKYGANAFASKLKKRGYPAFTEPVETSRGTLWRVRAGGYPTRAAAVEARNKLRADGHDGVVTAAK